MSVTRALFVVLAGASMAGTSYGAYATINGSGTVGGNGNTGFGGVIGTGSLYVETFGDGTVNMTLTRGAGEFFDLAAMYVDSVSGGITNTSALTDTGGGGDAGRAGLSGQGFGGELSDLGFAPGFGADYGITWEAAYSGLFDLVNTPSNFAFVAGVITDGSRSSSDASWHISFNMSQIGIAPGDSFKLLVSYLNSSNAYRSGEFIGADDTGPFPADPNIGNNSWDLQTDDFILVNSVPSPGPIALGLLGGLAAIRRRR